VLEGLHVARELCYDVEVECVYLTAIVDIYTLVFSLFTQSKPKSKPNTSRNSSTQHKSTHSKQNESVSPVSSKTQNVKSENQNSKVTQGLPQEFRHCEISQPWMSRLMLRLFGAVRKGRRKSKASINEQDKDVATATKVFLQAVTRKVKCQ